MIAFWIWAGLLSTVSAAALWKGGPTERFAAFAYFGCWIATLVLHNPDRHATQWAVFAVDVLLLLLLAGLALRTDRYWPMYMAGFQLLAVVTHAGRIVDKTMGAWAYFTAAQIWGYLAIFALIYGVWSGSRRRRQLASIGAPMADPGATLR